jgi:exopolysaccharide production protein ExoQ
MNRVPLVPLSQARVETQSRGRMLRYLAAIIVLTALAIGFGPQWLMSDGSLKTLIAVSLFAAPLCVVLALAKARALNANQTAFRLALLIWWYLLISDALFDRISNVQGTYQGQYSIDAYGEVVTWMAAFVVLVMISLTNADYLYNLFSGSYKWASLFALSCLLAVTYSPSPAYSAGWWFKLFVIVLTLRLCLSGMDSIENVRAFLWASLWGLVGAVALPLSRALADPLTMFEGVGGRLNADPVVLSVTSSCILILALTLNASRKHFWLNFVALASVMTMILSAGKTGILAGVISAAAFFLLQKRVASGLAVIAGVALVGMLVIMTVTPVGNYFMHYSGGSTLTGRTEIWQMALPGIRQRPFLGHGYLATKFMWVNMTGPFAEAGHLHNGFLETLYNNGVVGLICLLGLHGSILANLLFARKTSATLHARLDLGVLNVLVVGSFCLYLDLLINGFFTVAFGGRPTAHFMMFLAVLAWSIALRALAVRVSERTLVPTLGSKTPPKPFASPAPMRPGAMGSPSLG